MYCLLPAVTKHQPTNNMSFPQQPLPLPWCNATMISRKVAVIGAGPSGLVASRELLREGHEVVVFERSDRVGGAWVYNSNVESDPLGLDPSRSIIHASLYDSLRTNLPREIMGFTDYPFVPQRDPRRFPHHSEVLHYLEDFANHFQLVELIRFETEVIYVGLLEEEEELKNCWVVKSRKKGGVGSSSAVARDVFDAVVVCSGHYTHPNIAEIPGIDAWPGKQLHSHSYRVPEPFSGQVVLIIGNKTSAADISKEISTVAKEIHVASRSTNVIPTNMFGSNNVWHHSMVKRAHEDGTVEFPDGSLVHVDVIVHCTGYKYYFPFLGIGDTLTVDDNRVGPLYKHIFPPKFAPGLSFMGIPWMALPFPIFELKGKWVAGVLSGRISLPSKDKMIEDVEAFYSQLKAAAIPKRFTHMLAEKQFDYSDWLAAESGCQPWEQWRKLMFKEWGRNFIARPETYRDEWEDEDLIVQAHEDFSQYLPAELCGQDKQAVLS